jgi:hypothetical protein
LFSPGFAAYAARFDAAIVRDGAKAANRKALN